MKWKEQGHTIENVFVLVLFVLFAAGVTGVLALGAGSYKKLVKRDTDNYNKQILTTYISARIQSNDVEQGVAIGGFQKAETPDGIQTLHLYEEHKDGVYDTRIYYYKGQIYELATLKGVSLEYNAGTPIMEAKGLAFSRRGNRIIVEATDVDGSCQQVSVTLHGNS